MGAILKPATPPNEFMSRVTNIAGPRRSGQEAVGDRSSSGKEAEEEETEKPWVNEFLRSEINGEPNDSSEKEQ